MSETRSQLVEGYAGNYIRNVKSFLQAGADPKIKDNAGHNAEDYHKMGTGDIEARVEARIRAETPINPFKIR
jgi:hypothetical protein